MWLQPRSDPRPFRPFANTRWVQRQTRTQPVSVVLPDVPGTARALWKDPG